MSLEAQVAVQRGTLALDVAVEVADGLHPYLAVLEKMPEGQALAAKHYFRARDLSHAAREDAARFPKVELFTIDQAFGGWQKAQKTHFVDNGVYDQIFKESR